MNPRRQLFRDFDCMTCMAIALGIVLLAVLVMRGVEDDYQQQKGQDDDRQDSNAVDRDGAKENRPAVEHLRPVQDSPRGAGVPGAAQLQPCAGDPAAARRGQDSRRLFDAIRRVESNGDDAMGD